eukprot:11006519-Alexandrium_andersonii.AAC.1
MSGAGRLLGAGCRCGAECQGPSFVGAPVWVWARLRVGLGIARAAVVLCGRLRVVRLASSLLVFGTDG